LLFQMSEWHHLDLKVGGRCFVSNRRNFDAWLDR
jgi:hypothetical protein